MFGCVGYSDKDILSSFTIKLKEFAKKKKGIYIKIDPDIKLQNLTIDGEVIEGDNNFPLVDYMKKIGYKHLGFNKAFEHNQPRYTFRLKLKDTIEEVRDGFHNTTNKVINKGNMYNLEVKKNDVKYIDDFYADETFDYLILYNEDDKKTRSEEVDDFKKGKRKYYISHLT